MLTPRWALTPVKEVKTFWGCDVCFSFSGRSGGAGEATHGTCVVITEP